LGTIERHLVEGLAEADSITFDPHKGLMQPFEMGCVLVRDRRLLRATFATHPEYLQDTVGQDDVEP
jgi:glutamate/tyrosine decarboxylase-like PLP-dependent enzyme